LVLFFREFIRDIYVLKFWDKDAIRLDEGFCWRLGLCLADVFGAMTGGSFQGERGVKQNGCEGREKIVGCL